MQMLDSVHKLIASCRNGLVHTGLPVAEAAANEAILSKVMLKHVICHNGFARPTSELCMCASVSEMIGTRHTSWLNHRHERIVS